MWSRAETPITRRVTKERGGEVEDELQGERGHADGSDVPGRRPRPGKSQHERRTSRVPRADGEERQPVHRHPPLDELRNGAEDQAAENRKRKHARREEEPHCDEDALGRDGVAAGELELHTRCEGVAEDGYDQSHGRDVPVTRRDGDRRRGEHEEGARHEAGRVPPRQMARRARATELDQRVVAQPVGRGRRRRPTHAQMIGTLGRALDASRR
jgi:hypothetical protein